jgi:transcriptional regulator with XRE-family HTH domain
MLLNVDRLKRARQDKGLTLDELGRLSGLDKSQIFRYERGDNDPSSTVLAILAGILDVSTDYLLNLTDNPKGILGEDLTSAERMLLSAYRSANARALFELVADRLKQMPE